MFDLPFSPVQGHFSHLNPHLGGLQLVLGCLILHQGGVVALIAAGGFGLNVHPF